MYIRLYPLYDLISHPGEEKVQACLDNFVCDRDEDVSLFLKKFAIESELSHKLRTYVAIDEDADCLSAVGFFTVGVAFVVEEGESDGSTLSSAQTPVFLLSQIARDDRYDSDTLSGVELLAEAEDIIWRSSDLTGGSAIFLDCKDALRSYYEDKGYVFISYDEDTKLNRMTKPIY